MEPSNCDTNSGIDEQQGSNRAPFIFDQYPDLYKLCKRLIEVTSEKYWSRRQLNKTSFINELQLLRRAFDDIRATQSSAYKEAVHAANAVQDDAYNEARRIWKATDSNLRTEREAVEPTTDGSLESASIELRAKQAEYEMQASLGLFNKSAWLAENSRQIEEASATCQLSYETAKAAFKQSLAKHAEQREVLENLERLTLESHSQREIAAFEALESWFDTVKLQRAEMLANFLRTKCVETFRNDILRAMVKVQMNLI